MTSAVTIGQLFKSIGIDHGRITIECNGNDCRIVKARPSKVYCSLEAQWIDTAPLTFDQVAQCLETSGYLQGSYLSLPGSGLRAFKKILKDNHCIPPMSNTEFFESLQMHFTLKVKDARSLRGEHKYEDEFTKELEDFFPLN